MTLEGDRRTSAEAAAKPKTCPSCATRYPADALFCSLDGAPLTTSPVAIAVAATSDPYVGREILGHIEIRQLVGIGAMGRVYRAFQTGIDRDVAVKILHRELSANQTLVARFHREAKVASRLAHPHVVHVLLVGQLPDGAMYIVMEYLDGLSLQSAMGAVGGAMPLPRALHIALQLCDAAGEAHAQEIVHRDLKPENVMLVMRADDPDYVKVLDFGIARLNWDENSTTTAAGLIFGTARYISPEGAQGERVGPQGDVYSIATMVYQMLAGRAPFDADQAVALLVQQIHDPPPDLKSIRRAAYVPDAIAAVIMKNLGKRPEDRSEDARAFGRALLEAAVSSGLSAQDILARPAMLGRPRGIHSSVVQMPSMQRTKQHQLDADTKARMEGPPMTAPGTREEPVFAGGRAPASSTERGRRVTAYETPGAVVIDASATQYDAHGGRALTRTEIPEPDLVAPMVPPMLAPAAATARWSSASDFEGARISPGPSSVDATMDDQQVPLARVRPPTPAPVSRPPPPSANAPPEASDPAIARPPASASAARSRVDSRVQPIEGPVSRPVSEVSRAPSSGGSTPGGAAGLETTIGDDEQEEDDEAAHLARVSRARTRTLGLVVVCFFVGAIGMAGLAWRAGLIFGGAHPATLSAVVARANDALVHKRWDTPAGDNVRDLTEDGLAQWPADPQLLGIRALACDQILKGARDWYARGDVSEAQRLAQVAARVDPSNQQAAALVADWTQELSRPPPPVEPSVPPLASGHGGWTPGATGAGAPGGAAAAGAARVAIDASSAKPDIGQPVDFVAHVVGGAAATRARLESGRFRIAGPGIEGGTELRADDDGAGAFRATFTFFQSGRFDVAFAAKADGAPVRGARTVVVTGPAPAAPAESAPPAPAPPASANWL